jgi:hypothetical protein
VDVDAGQQFLDMLREDVDLLADAEAAMLGVIEALRHSGGKGSVTLKFTVTQPKKAGERAAFWIRGAVTSTAPAPEHEDHLFYAVDGRITRRDPRQPSLPAFRSVGKDAEPDEHREVEAL